MQGKRAGLDWISEKASRCRRERNLWTSVLKEYLGRVRKGLRQKDTTSESEKEELTQILKRGQNIQVSRRKQVTDTNGEKFQGKCGYQHQK